MCEAKGVHVSRRGCNSARLAPIRQIRLAVLRHWLRACSNEEHAMRAYTNVHMRSVP